MKVAYIPILCQHCEEAPCISSSPSGTVYRRPDGIVLIDPEKAFDHKEIVNLCPHRVIYWNEEKRLPQKCTFCAHLLDGGWKEPRCVEVCPTGALVFGDLGDPESETAKLMDSRKTGDLRPEFELKPRVAYAGLPKRFIAGEVVLSDRRDECAEGVNVTLTGGDRSRARITDNYGDFEFEDLDEAEFTLKIEHPGYTHRSFKVRTNQDLYLGEIYLEPTKEEPR